MEGILETILDKIGQEITVGSFIAYGHLLSRSAGLRIGKVLKTEVEYKPSSYPHTSVWDTEYKIHVWGIDQEWGQRPATILSRKSVLNFPDRIVVLQDLPLELKLLLDGLEFDTKLVYCSPCEGRGYFPLRNFSQCINCSGRGKVKP